MARDAVGPGSDLMIVRTTNRHLHVRRFRCSTCRRRSWTWEWVVVRVSKERDLGCKGLRDTRETSSTSTSTRMMTRD